MIDINTFQILAQDFDLCPLLSLVKQTKRRRKLFPDFDKLSICTSDHTAAEGRREASRAEGVGGLRAAHAHPAQKVSATSRCHVKKIDNWKENILVIESMVTLITYSI